MKTSFLAKAASQLYQCGAFTLTRFATQQIRTALFSDMTDILILSSAKDAHVVPVLEHLTDLGAKVSTLRNEDFASAYSVKCAIGNLNTESTLVINNDKIDLLAIKSIWHRRPGNFPTPSYAEPFVGKMIESETRDTITGMFNSLPCLWVNKPFHDANTMKKLAQLKQAHLHGLEVPQSLVTNSPEAAKKFFEQCNGQVIYKLIGETTGQFLPQSEIGGIPTLPLREVDLKYLNQVVHAPHLFQEMIPKTHDIRVTVVGKKLFGCRIYSQAGQGKVDWRGDYSVQMEPMEIPVDLEEKVFALMKYFNLNYGAFDFCQTKDERYVFIEVNSAGQFLWMEERTKQPIALEVAKLLARYAEPLCL